MHFRFSSALLLALCLLAPSAFAQLTIKTVDAKGINTGVTTRFTFTVDPWTNRLTIQVDNTHASATGVQGTITSFGFNTPFSDAQLGNNGSNVSFTEVWTTKLVGHTTSKWNIFEPYSISQNGGYSEELGVGTGNTPTGGTSANGIKFGEKVTFTFQFPDFTAAQVAGFFDSNSDLVVRWQEVGIGCSNGWSDFGPTDIPPTPEPSTYGLMGAAALFACVAIRRRKQKKVAVKELEKISA